MRSTVKGHLLVLVALSAWTCSKQQSVARSDGTGGLGDGSGGSVGGSGGGATGTGGQGATGGNADAAAGAGGTGTGGSPRADAGTGSDGRRTTDGGRDATTGSGGVGSGGTGGAKGTGGSTGAGGTSPSTCTATPTIELIGNKIYDTSGTPFVARGAEYVVASTDQTSGIDNLAGKGANALRLLLTLDAVNAMSPADFDTLIGRAVSHQMVVWVSLYSWDKDNNYIIGNSLGGGNFYALTAPTGTGTCSSATPAPCYLAVWSRQWLKDLMAKYKGHVIIDAMQEFIGVAAEDSEAGRVEWATAAKSNIKFFRAAGYIEPLEVMASYEGRDLYGIVEHGAEIRAVDTITVGADPQTMFGWQAYWAATWYKTWQGGLLLGGTGSITGAQAIHQFALTQPFPIEIGLDNYSTDTASEYKAEMDQAALDGASWLWWSWKDANVECPVDGATCQTYVTTSTNGLAGAVRSACGL